MSKRLLLVADGKMYFTDGDEAVELPSETLRHYLDTLRRSVKAKEWKSAAASPLSEIGETQTAEEAVRSVRGHINDIGMYRGQLLYSISIQDSGGIYHKDAKDLSVEGITVSSQEEEYLGFSVDRERGRVIYSVSSIGEVHLGLHDMETKRSRLITEGESREYSPVFDPSDPERILYSGCGISVPEAAKVEREGLTSLPSMLRLASQKITYGVGPRGIFSLSLTSGRIDEIKADGKYDFLSPAIGQDGALYCIRRPYREEEKTGGIGQFFKTVLNILLLPFRLLIALFGFLSVFSMKYGGGDPMTGGAKSKSRSQKELFIEGNLIDAEKERKRNKAAGEEEPGWVPRSYQLLRIGKDGKETVLCKGVSAFALCGDEIFVSNGSAVLRLAEDGKKEKAIRLENVSVIRQAE